MPRYPIDRATNFIVEDESWTVVEYDHTSVPGVIYLSLTEGKVNLIYDDLQNDIADTDKLAQYNLLVPSEIQVFNIGDVIEPVFTLTKNGIPINLETELISQNKQIAKVVNGQLTAIADGEVDIIVQLKDIPSITNMIHIRVGGTSEFSAYIEGIENIRLDRDASYKLIGTSAINGSVIFSIDNEELVKIVSVEADKCILHANDKNILGSFTLSATYNNVEYTKTISIIPVW